MEDSVTRVKMVLTTPATVSEDILGLTVKQVTTAKTLALQMEGGGSGGGGCSCTNGNVTEPLSKGHDLESQSANDMYCMMVIISASDLCLNGGTCGLRRNGDGYFCHCLQGYTGQHCETGTLGPKRHHSISLLILMAIYRGMNITTLLKLCYVYQKYRILDITRHYFHTIWT